MTDQRKKTGKQGELLAVNFLQSRNYQIVTCNWRCSVGELDIIARQNETLIFVEVRTRRGAGLGTPEESITLTKQAKLIELAYTYLEQHNCPSCDWRIDVIAVVLGNGAADIRHIISAVNG